MQKLRLLSSIILLLSGFILKGQNQDAFTRDDEAFLQEITDLFSELDRRQRNEAMNYVDTFATIWKSGVLMDYQKEWVYKTMDALTKTRLRPYPEYLIYFDTFSKLMKSRDADVNFEEWHKSFQPLITIQNQRRLLQYWEKTRLLFQQNILSQSASSTWYLRNTRYRIVYEEDTSWLTFEQGNLVCHVRGDSSIIHNTNGRLHLMDNLLFASGGTYNWARVNLNPNQVYAQLSDFNINLNFSRFEADSVTFYNLNYFDTGLEGKLTERLLAEVKPEDSRYPRFESYQVLHEIENLYPGVNFRGGFTITGQRIIGSGTDDGFASLNFYRNDSLFITARSQAFSIRQDRVVSDRAQVSIYLSGDSIYHPGLFMRYTEQTKEFYLQREENGFSRAPFFNTFHKIDMYGEALVWHVDQMDMELRRVRGMSTEGTAVFESHNFFSDIRYMRLQGMSQMHPLMMLKDYAEKIVGVEFTALDFARFIRIDSGNTRALLANLSHFGFIDFNEETDMVTLNQRLFHYIGAYAGNTDFDVIRLESQASVNARLNMNNFDLHVNGVERIPLSDVKNVVLHPDGKQFVMKKNRDIYFDGRIESGLFDFYGKEFFFNYDKFKVDLIETDSMSFRVKSFDSDSRGRHSFVRVRTVLEGINGELLVDHPSNKSGQLNYPRYPIFNSDNESYVYYDREFVQDGVYRREDVYFRLIPFSIDSLDNATTDNIAFDGVFISTGIFPDFYDYLTVQPDYSLGFNTQTPEDGYPIYGNKAIYKGPIDMSYEGLRADGRLEYLNSTLEAREMLMFPDSARAKVRRFDMTAQTAPVEYPEVAAFDVDMLYLPHEDNLSITKSEKAIELYGGLALMHGSIDLTPTGLQGNGNMDFFGGEMQSEEFVYKQKDFTTELSDLRIHDPEKTETLLAAYGYSSYVDMLTHQTAELKTVKNDAKIDFVINRYHGYGFDFEWDMSQGLLNMQNKLDNEVRQAAPTNKEDWIHYDFGKQELISTHPGQDSLRYFAGKIDYSIHEKNINAQNINIIKVADAAIFPDKGELTVLPRAEIRPLENAEILANTDSLHHRFYNASANITSRRFYRGDGHYDYIDENGNTQQLFFESISTDRAFLTTIATATIEESQDFTLSPRFGFQGEANLRAENPNLTYKGAAQIKADCGPLQSHWVRFEAELQADSIYIPLAEDLRNEANGVIKTSIMLAGDSLHIYPAILSRQNHYSDMEILRADGYLTFDPVLRQYKIASLEKLENHDHVGNMIRINPATCMIYGHGDVTLAEDLGQFHLKTFGDILYNPREETIDFDLIMGIDFFFLNTALGLTENNIRKHSEKLNNVNINRQKYLSYLRETIGVEAQNQLMEQYLETGEFRRYPRELSHTFFFADIKMSWDQNTTRFFSTEPLGLGSMESDPINQYIDGFIEINKHRGNSVFNMVLIPSGMAAEGIGTDWYFFNYASGIMQTIASDNDFNTMIRDVRPRRRRMEVERGEEPFTFILSSDRRPLDFIRSMRGVQ